MRLWLFAAWTSVALQAKAYPAMEPFNLYDESRSRQVPVAVFLPAPAACARACPVVLFGTGYRALASDYSFLLQALADAGYLAVAVQHDLSDDTPIPNTGNVSRDRTPHWLRGAANIEFSFQTLSSRYPQHDWSDLTLAGHSQGGDIAALLVARGSLRARALLTLDNRRVALPPVGRLPTLTLRSSDQPADPGVLPEVGVQDRGHTCIVRLSGIRHDDMNDHADARSRALIVGTTLGFLQRRECKTGEA